MLFSAVTKIGQFEIERIDGSKVIYTIKPFDIRIMEEVNGLPKNLSHVENINRQIAIFCPEYQSEDLHGIPINTLTEMIEYIVETSQGKNRTEEEKKTASKKPIKP